jgi:hypothetical protein
MTTNQSKNGIQNAELIHLYRDHQQIMYGLEFNEVFANNDSLWLVPEGHWELARKVTKLKHKVGIMQARQRKAYRKKSSMPPKSRIKVAYLIDSFVVRCDSFREFYRESRHWKVDSYPMDHLLQIEEILEARIKEIKIT